MRLDENSAGAISIIRFGVDGIPNTTELIDNQGNIDYNRITTFSAADYGFLFSYARKFQQIEGLYTGASLKIIRRVIGDFAGSWGFGIDLGAQYTFKKWNFGFMARDITSTFNAWSYSLSDRMIEVFQQTENELPQNGLELTMPKIILGASRKFVFWNKLSVLPALDFDISTDGKRNVLISGKPFSIDPHIGLEVGYTDLFFVRAGYGNMQRESDFAREKFWSYQFNIGVGVVIKKLISIDYALSDIGDRSIAIYSHIFSLKLMLNKKTEKNKTSF